MIVALGSAQIEQESIDETLYHNHLITVGAERLDEYLPLLRGKRVGIVVNQTSMVKEMHLADVLLAEKINVKKIFSPEHGFRGSADAGESVKDGMDVKTGLPLISLYGKNKKPGKKQMADLDTLIFDIQDVGARFYTYISTMHYVMEAAAENGKQVIILDRPNPNGFYVAGPVMEDEFKSFVGVHNVPIVHGMTVGEYAKMINGEKWLKGDLRCDLIVIQCAGYDHKKHYKLPVNPSPNLPNMHAIYLYPSLCLLEGTDVSVGRGTDKQFQIVGSPNLSNRRIGERPLGLLELIKFTPEKMVGAKFPKHEGKLCAGFDMSSIDVRSLREMKVDLNLIRGIYQLHINKPVFFNDFFEKLAGNKSLRKLVAMKLGAAEEKKITLKYKTDLERFKSLRRKYLLYPDFE